MQNTFELLRRQPIESLKLEMQAYRHLKTGALHYHLACDQTENVFMVALRTVPQDSTGVAHILEHTTLCGSQKYPVRDPFFMMTRRSLNTFMNAFTSADWTGYPFASQNKKDFNNLLEVYLDAVFFPNLNPLDFAQEGHRLEFKNNDPAEELEIKGVVYNEMKGAMSAPASQLWHQVSHYLFPTTTYHYNSGGDPAQIPELSYQQLTDFWRTYYHPSNAVFFTFGDIPAASHQQIFEKNVLSRFQNAAENKMTLTNEVRYHAPVFAETFYPLDPSETAANKTHIVFAWLLSEAGDLQTNLAMRLLSSLLLDNSASPLLQALETSSLGNAPSPLLGLDDDHKEMVFMCGLEGSEAKHADALQQEIFAVLEKIAEEGMTQSQIDAALHQLELAQREITGGNHPYGLQLIMRCLPAAIHDADPIRYLDVDTALKELKQLAKNPDFIKNLVRKHFLENQHMVRMIMSPDQALAAKEQATLKMRLQALKNGMDAATKQALVAQAKQLAERQAVKDDPNILPKVTISDVPETIQIPVSQKSQLAQTEITSYAQGTNGLIYESIILPLASIPADLMPYLPWYTEVLTELGIAEADYLHVQSRQAASVGAINADVKYFSDRTNPEKLSAYLVLSAKGLQRNHAVMAQLLLETRHHTRFDEQQRLKELMAQMLADKEQSITASGHSLAMTAAAQTLSPANYIFHQYYGLQAIKHLKALDQSLISDAALGQLAEKLRQIHALMQTSRERFLLIAEPEAITHAVQDLKNIWCEATQKKPLQPFQVDFKPQPVRQFWFCNTQVNFCAKAFRAVPYTHPDAPILAVLAVFLRNGYLHTAIREKGGAYGGGASYDANHAAFKFYSYRDPRLTETLKDFDRSIDWVLTASIDQAAIEEAILGVIGVLDKPSSPAGEAQKAYFLELSGLDRAAREKFRHAVLAVTGDDLKRTAQNYLKNGEENLAIVSHSAHEALAKDLQCELIKL